MTRAEIEAVAEGTKGLLKEALAELLQEIPGFRQLLAAREVSFGKEALAELLGEIPAFRAFLGGSSGAGASSSKDGSEEISGSKLL